MKKFFMLLIIIIIGWAAYVFLFDSDKNNETMRDTESTQEGSELVNTVPGTESERRAFSDVDPTSLTKEDFVSRDVCLSDRSDEKVVLMLPEFLSVVEPTSCENKGLSGAYELQFEDGFAEPGTSRATLYEQDILTYTYVDDGRPVLVVYNTAVGYLSYWRRFSPTVGDISTIFEDPYLIVTTGAEMTGVQELVYVDDSEQVTLPCDRAALINAFGTPVFSPDKQRGVFWCDGHISVIELATGAENELLACAEYDDCKYIAVGWKGNNVVRYANQEEIVGTTPPGGPILQAYTIDLRTKETQEDGEFAKPGV